MVSDHGLLCHGFEPSTTEDPPYRALNLSRAQTSSRWCERSVRTHAFLNSATNRNIPRFHAPKNQRKQFGSLIYRELQRHLVETGDEMVRVELHGQSMYVLWELRSRIYHGFLVTSVLGRTIGRCLRNGRPLDWRTWMRK
ncbi:hypothetical protein TNCV_2126411 [Trichonephila clavipes]|nr:hypothetical protein TNCV_2126411 [Trichonephila clavipes]